MLPSARSVLGQAAHSLLLKAGFAAKAAEPAAAAAAAKTNWAAVTLPKTASEVPNTTGSGQAFAKDLRSTSGLGLGDACKTHTDKWLQGDQTSPLEYIGSTKPIKVKGLVVASHGTDDPLLGCPVEYISLKGTSEDKPAVCKYTGNKYYSDDWKHGGHH